MHQQNATAQLAAPPTPPFAAEFINGSAISPELFNASIEIIEDTGYWEPNHALGHEVRTQWQTRKNHGFETLAGFIQESGELWQGKPSNPRPHWKKTKKNLANLGWDGDLWQGLKLHPSARVNQKYETPVGSGARAYLPPIPPSIRQAIAQRYNIDVPLTGPFWPWLADHPEIPIILTEGGKKALSLLTQGYVAIALYGVNGGYSAKDRLGNPIPRQLIPDLLPFAQPERPLTLAFDQDIAPQTRRRVACAQLRLGRLLQTAGGQVQIAEWQAADGKGLDDLIVRRGPDAADRALATAMPLAEWHLLQRLRGQLTRKADQRLNLPSLETLDPAVIPTEGIVAIAAAKGTGKTKLTAQLVGTNGPTLLAGHRIALMRNLCDRLHLKYRGDLDQVQGRFHDGAAYVVRVGTCVDSLINLAFNPANFQNCDLVIDEAVQVLRHLLTSATCNRDGKRGAILRRFERLVKTAKRVILADADLNTDVITYIETLRGGGQRAFLLVNDYQPAPYPVTWIETHSSSAIVGQLLADVQAGQRIFVTTDSLGGSKRLNKLITQIEAAGGRTLLINSETSGGEAEQALITHPATEVGQYNVVIASPSLGTGWSEESNHFDVVYGIFWGNSATDADISQALARVRAPIPRVVWCSQQGGAFSRICRDTHPQAIKETLKLQLSATATILADQLDTGIHSELVHYDWTNPHLELFSRIEADRNRAMWSLRSALKVRLIHEGHDLSIQTLAENEAALELLKQAKATLKADHAKAVANATEITPLTASALEQAEALSPDEQLALEKYHLSQFYCCDVTEELVLADDNGQRRRRLARLEATLDPTLAIERDIAALEQQQRWQAGLSPWDLPKATLQRLAREKLGLLPFLNPEQRWTSDDLDAFKNQALNLAIPIKQCLGITLKATMSGAQILGMLLQQLGLKTESQQVRSEGTRQRIYGLSAAVWQSGQAILERRAQQRQPASHTPAIEDQAERVCDAVEPLIQKGFAVGDLVRVVATGTVALVEEIQGAIALLSAESGGLSPVSMDALRAIG